MAKQLQDAARVDADRQKECFQIMIAEVQRLEKILGTGLNGEIQELIKTI